MIKLSEAKNSGIWVKGQALEVKDSLNRDPYRDTDTSPRFICSHFEENEAPELLVYIPKGLNWGLSPFFLRFIYIRERRFLSLSQ